MIVTLKRQKMSGIDRRCFTQQNKAPVMNQPRRHRKNLLKRQSINFMQVCEEQREMSENIISYFCRSGPKLFSVADQHKSEKSRRCTDLN